MIVKVQIIFFVVIMTITCCVSSWKFDAVLLLFCGKWDLKTVGKLVSDYWSFCFDLLTEPSTAVVCGEEKTLQSAGILRLFVLDAALLRCYLWLVFLLLLSLLLTRIYSLAFCDWFDREILCCKCFDFCII